MNVAVRRPRMSMDDFLAWESQQQERWEFDGLEPRAMVGANSRHHRIVASLAAALREGLRGRCLVYTETMKLKLGRTWRYPDVMVVCTEVADDAIFVMDPILNVEVLSAGTARDDEIFKNREYQEVASVKRYVVLEQEVRAAAIYAGERLLGALDACERRHTVDARDRPRVSPDPRLCRPRCNSLLATVAGWIGTRLTPPP